MNRTVSNDGDFGPVVRSHRDNFDFTILFENTVLSIAPSILVLILAAGRICYLYRKPTLIREKKFQSSKLIALVVYGALQTALTALWASQPILRSWSSTTAAILTLFNVFVFCLISHLEHCRSRTPSTILIVYLLISTICDIVRVRSVWLVAPDSPLAHLFTASVVFKFLVLVLEAGEKARYLPVQMTKRRPEETSSILNRGAFYWLNRLMFRGAHHVLFPNELYELKLGMTADQLGDAYLRHWRRAHTRSKHAALWSMVKTLRWPLLAPIFPRVCLLALTICKPILLRELLTYLSAPSDTTSKKIGYGLIGAHALVYIGSAVATGFYWYKQYQFLTMIRSCLVPAIGWRTTTLNVQAVGDPKAGVTLMSTDVERITEGLRPLHDFWASILQLGIALYLLQRQMGVACVVTVIVAILCSAGTASVSSSSIKRQVKWMEVVQERIGLTSAVLSSMRGVKMRGLIDILGEKIQASRSQEIRYSNRWRSLLLVTVCFSFIPEYLSPMLTFLVYIIQARASREIFDVARAFTTLSLISIMTEPLQGLLQSVPGLVSAVGCFSRIGQFLAAEEQEDFRDFGSYQGSSLTPAQTLVDGSGVIELDSRCPKTLSMLPTAWQPVVRITNGCFGWSKDNDILKDVNITIPGCQLTCIVGPIAGGKSTLCQTLLGETYASKGQVQFSIPSKEIAFCHQTAHLVNGSIEENIVGFSELDRKWYETVLRACSLWEDICLMPKQHGTIVGSGGMNLSGGQRQKVAIARAIYARKSIVILDDVFSGFDTGSEQHVFRQLFGPDGLARRQGMTIIFATHAVKFLPYADHIIALVDGAVEQEGTYEELRSQSGYVQRLAIEVPSKDQPATAKESATETGKAQDAADAAKDDLSRQLGDFAVYRYYFSAAGLTSTVLMLAFGTATSTFFNLPTFWLKQWTDASSISGQHDDYRYLGIYALFQCLALIFVMLLAYQTIIVLVTKTGLDLHLRLLQTVANAKLAFFSTTDSGSITNRFSQDMQLIDMQLPIGMMNLTFSVFVALGQMILIIASSPWVGLAFPVIISVFYAVQEFYLRTSRQLRFLDLEAKSPLYTNFLETLNGLATIRAFGWTKQNLALNYKLLDSSQKPLYLLYMIQRWLSFVLDIIVAVLAILIATLAVVQSANSGFAGIALTQVLLINLTLRSIIVSWTEVETSIGSVSRIKDFTESVSSEHKQAETQLPSIDWPQSGKVEFRDLTATYETTPGEPALRNLDLIILPGEKLGVCGRSGSGKSSLVLALLRMLEIQSGSLKIDDLDLQLVPRNVVRERINVIPQDSLLLPGTVRMNLDPTNVHTNSSLIEALKKVDLWPTIEAKAGLETEISGDILSHGQRQLFSLASAILKKASVVILDEATSNVDHATDELMQSIIRQEFNGCTIIAVAHRINTIMDSDKIAVLSHGVLCELDTPQALLSTQSIFRSMWGERQADKKTS